LVVDSDDRVLLGFEEAGEVGNGWGSGTTIINGQSFHWQKGATFIVPLGSWHEHADGPASDKAILFSMHDEPILRAFGLYREEARTMEKF